MCLEDIFVRPSETLAGSDSCFCFSGCPVIKLIIAPVGDMAAEGEIYWKIKIE